MGLRQVSVSELWGVLGEEQGTHECLQRGERASSAAGPVRASAPVAWARAVAERRAASSQVGSVGLGGYVAAGLVGEVQRCADTGAQ